MKRTFLRVTDVNNRTHLINIFMIVTINSKYVTLDKTQNLEKQSRFIEIDDKEFDRITTELGKHLSLIDSN